MVEEPEPGGEYVQSLARGLKVVTAFDGDHRSMSLSAVAARAGLTRATARRLLHTLVTLGYVRHVDGEFALTPQVLRLGTAYLSGLGLPEVAQPHLEALSAQEGQSSSVAVLDGTDIVYVARVATRRLMAVGITVGTRFPAYATSLGRVLLAGLPAGERDDVLRASDRTPLTPHTRTSLVDLRATLTEVAADGYAVVDQELEVGLRSLAVPLLGPDGSVVAALNVSTSASGVDRTDELVAALRSTASAISGDLTLTSR